MREKQGSIEGNTVLFVFIIIAAFAVFTVIVVFVLPYISESGKPADLSFTVDPAGSWRLNAGGQYSFSVHVSNAGGKADDVLPVIDAQGFTYLALQTMSIDPGKTGHWNVQIQVEDIQDSAYSSTIWIRYRDTQGEQTTGSKTLDYHILPNIEIKDVHWMLDPIFEKHKIKTTDETSLIFKIRSNSNKIYYYGMTASAVFDVVVPNLQVSSGLIEVRDVGPNGETEEYGFIISATNAPPGEYTIRIQVYSKDGQLVETSDPHVLTVEA